MAVTIPDTVTKSRPMSGTGSMTMTVSMSRAVTVTKAWIRQGDTKGVKACMAVAGCTIKSVLFFPLPCKLFLQLLLPWFEVTFPCLEFTCMLFFQLLKLTCFMFHQLFPLLILKLFKLTKCGFERFSQLFKLSLLLDLLPLLFSLVPLLFRFLESFQPFPFIFMIG